MKTTCFLVGALLLGGALRAQISVYECTPENSLVSQQELAGGQAEIYKPCLLFENQNYTWAGSQVKTLQGINGVEIKSPFYGKPVGSGSLHLKAGNKSEFDVVCMNYPDLSGIKRYEKLEFGVTLPENVQQKIDNFILQSGSERINPYMDWEIRISVDFTHPQIPYDLTVDAFYNKEYEAWMVDDIPSTVPEGKYLDNFEGNNYTGFWNELGGYNELPTDYPFLARFSPPKTGKWDCTVRMYLADETYISEPFSFTVLESSNPGYVWVGDESRYFKLGNHGFYPVGANILWPTTEDVENNPGYSDPELQELLKYTYTDEQNQTKTIVLSEDYRKLRPIPRVFDNYRELIGNIANGGGNFVRLIMNPVSLDIEYEKIGDYTDRLYIAQELDEVLEYCESRHVYIDWNMLIHYVLMPVNQPGYTIAWNKKDEWQQYDYCYGHLEGVDDPVDFFTNPLAKGYYKQRLRYILSRWGYSTNIALFELMSEINTGEIFTGIPHSQIGPEHAEIIEGWQQEMITYIKERYNGATHMLAPSYAGLKLKNDDTFKDPRIEVMTSNVYPGLKCYAKNWIDQIQKEYLNQSMEASNESTTYTAWKDGNIQYSFRKPFLMSEYNPTQETCDPNQVEVRRALWQSLFSGAAGALSWYSYQNGILFPEYQRVRDFSSNFDLDNGGWHPGAMEMVNNNWIYQDDWARDMDRYDKGNNNQTNKADLMYLRSKDKTQAIGVITNKTYNIHSAYDEGCIDTMWARLSALDETDNHFINPAFERQSVKINKIPSEVNLSLNGMKNGRYRIRYYRPDRLWQWEEESYNNGPKVEIEYELDDNPENYIILFHAVFDPAFNLPLAEDSLVLERDPEAEYFESLQKKELRGESPTDDLEIVIYPVPATDGLEISCNPFERIIHVELLGADGKLIQKFNVIQHHSQLDISQLGKGVYTLKFHTSNGETRDHKFIKI